LPHRHRFTRAVRQLKTLLSTADWHHGSIPSPVKSCPRQLKTLVPGGASIDAHISENASFAFDSPPPTPSLAASHHDGVDATPTAAAAQVAGGAVAASLIPCDFARVVRPEEASRETFDISHLADHSPRSAAKRSVTVPRKPTTGGRDIPPAAHRLLQNPPDTNSRVKDSRGSSCKTAQRRQCSSTQINDSREVITVKQWHTVRHRYVQRTQPCSGAGKQGSRIEVTVEGFKPERSMFMDRAPNGAGVASWVEEPPR
jgi:hypothetical protein